MIHIKYPFFFIARMGNQMLCDRFLKKNPIDKVTSSRKYDTPSRIKKCIARVFCLHHSAPFYCVCVCCSAK